LNQSLTLSDFFPGNQLQLSTEAAYGFTAGSIAFLLINAFLMLIGKVDYVPLFEVFTSLF